MYLLYYVVLIHEAFIDKMLKYYSTYYVMNYEQMVYWTTVQSVTLLELVRLFEYVLTKILNIRFYLLYNLE